MANLRSFDHHGLQEKIDEAMNALSQFDGSDTFETEMQEHEFLDSIDVGVTAALELVQRGYATPEQEAALYDYLQKYGLM